MLQILTRRVGNFKGVKIIYDNTTLDLGINNEDELRELADTFKEAIFDLMYGIEEEKYDETDSD